MELMAKPTVIIESNIPFAKGVLDEVAQVRYLSPAQIDAGAVRCCDALVTRTRTRCDARLLDGSRCRLIASATIGLDHVDLQYCASHGIEVCNAPGCNAPAVAQYVMASLLAAYDGDVASRTLGIVGVGHVGSIVKRWAEGLGMKTLCCDPPRARREGHAGFVGLDELCAGADALTIHTPYTRGGTDPTHRMFGLDRLLTLRPDQLIINSARGPIVDNAALATLLAEGRVWRAVIDCWENEPDINPDLLGRAFIATPHIAGYSRQGKIRATAMALGAVCSRFGLPRPELDVEMPEDAPATVTAQDVTRCYDPLADTADLRRWPAGFEALRNGYMLREECFGKSDDRHE